MLRITFSKFNDIFHQKSMKALQFFRKSKLFVLFSQFLSLKIDKIPYQFS